MKEKQGLNRTQELFYKLGFEEALADVLNMIDELKLKWGVEHDGAWEALDELTEQIKIY